MISKAILRYTMVSPRKVRQVINLVRGRDVLEALSVLQNIKRGARVQVANVLKSAVNNAVKKYPDIRQKDLYISNIAADDGPTLKRFKAAAMGRAVRIRKRTSHILVELDKK